MRGAHRRALTRPLWCLRKVAPLLALLWVAACSGDRRLPPIDATKAMERVVARELGPDFSVDDVLAEVGGETIRAVDLALYLEQMGGLTPAQALDDLIDAELLANAGLLDAEREELARSAGRSRGLAMSWVRHHVLEAVPEEQITAAAVEAALEAGEPALALGRPALRTASHLLLRPPEGEEEAARAAIVRALEELHAALLGVADLDAERLQAEAARIREALPHEGVQVVVDTHMTFPREAQAHVNWLGPAAVVEPFARAAFEAEVGALVGPVETEFGWHLILVERVHEAEPPSAEEARRAMHARLLAQARNTRMSEALRRLEERTRVRIEEDTVELILLDEVERAQRQHEQLGERGR